MDVSALATGPISTAPATLARAAAEQDIELKGSRRPGSPHRHRGRLPGGAEGTASGSPRPPHVRSQSMFHPAVLQVGGTANAPEGATIVLRNPHLVTMSPEGHHRIRRPLRDTALRLRVVEVVVVVVEVGADRAVGTADKW